MEISHNSFNLANFINTALPILSILISGSFSVYTVKAKIKADNKLTEANNKLETLKLEIERHNSRKERLSERQRMILFILQNITSNTVKVKDNGNIEEKIKQILKHKNNKDMFQLDIFHSPIYAFTNEISLSTCSERVMAIRLLIQEESYKEFEEFSHKSHSMIAAYSLLYRYLYEDFTGNIIDDLYLVKHNTNDYKDTKSSFEVSIKELYQKLKKKYFWDTLKN